MAIINRNAWSAGVLSKNQNALAGNNTLIILELLLVIIMFWVFSWLAGIITLTLTFITYIIVGKKAMQKHVEDYYPDLDKVLKGKKENK